MEMVLNTWRLNISFPVINMDAVETIFYSSSRRPSSGSLPASAGTRHVSGEHTYMRAKHPSHEIKTNFKILFNCVCGRGVVT